VIVNEAQDRLALFETTTLEASMNTGSGETSATPFDMAGLRGLGDADLSGPAVNNARLCPGLYLSWDDGGTGSDVTLSRDGDEMLAIQGGFEQMPTWFTLNFELGAGRLGAGDRIALIVEGHAEDAVSLPVFLRSTAAGQADDIDALNLLELGPETTINTVIVQLDWPAEAESFHTLLVKLPKDGTKVVLRNFRVIHVPAGRGPRVGRKTLSSFAV